MYQDTTGAGVYFCVCVSVFRSENICSDQLALKGPP